MSNPVVASIARPPADGDASEACVVAPKKAAGESVGAMGVKEDEAAKVNAIGERIRTLKQSKAEKEVIMAEVEKLQAAKAAYEKAVGEPFPAPAPAPAKKKKAAPAPAPAEGGLSKNEAKKAAKKAAAAAKKAEYASGNIAPKQPSADKKSDTKKAATAPGSKAPGSKVSAMDAAQVQAYLKSVSLEKYAKALAGVDGASLAAMDDGALKSRGVAFAPHRRKLLKLVSGSGADGSAAILAVALAGATVVATATPLLAAVKSALAAVEEQIGSVEGATPQSRGQSAGAAAPMSSAPAAAASQSQRPSAAATATSMDSALVAAAHRFYIAVGMRVEAQRSDGGSWEPAKVCGVPRDDLGCWQLQADGEGDWVAAVHFTAIRPRRRYAVQTAGTAAGTATTAAPPDWRIKLPAAKGVPRLQVLPGAKASSAGAAELAALNSINAELDGLEERVAKLEAKKKKSGRQ